MKVSDTGSVRYIVIEDVPALDPATLILKDYGGSGKVIAECYGEAWSTYFGGIGGNQSLEKFLSSCDASYLSGRLMNNNFKHTKIQKKYVNRVSQAIIDACKLKEESE